LFSIVFLIRYPYIERAVGIDNFRKKAGGALFWLIWFYMVTVTALGNPLFLSREVFVRMSSAEIVFMLFDRVLLIALFVLSVFFYSLPNKALELYRGVLRFDEKELPAELSEVNSSLLIDFVLKEGGVLCCDEILRKIHPEEAQHCSIGCKPSVCPSYQTLYKRIQVIRKYLETNGIGTIISPERKPYSKDQGWRFVVYEDVYTK